MHYISTRGDGQRILSAQAILRGIAPDGGLYVPEGFAKLDKSLEELSGLSYQALAYELLKHYLTDFTKEELQSCINRAYDEKFDDKRIAPVVKHAGVTFLELFHGPTLAFKDMALTLLPHLLTLSAKKCGQQKEIVILTATSGDTGKAAMEGFKDVPGTKVFVFYPKDGVSPMQRMQMVTQRGANVTAVAVEGDFDDSQTAVKTLFTDDALNAELAQAGYVFSSANSINIGRLLPQIVYYFYGYFQMAKGAIGEPIDICVPTGNFGNILAAYYAKQMGLPVGELICASNENKVLYDFFTSGIYDANRKLVVSNAPSMDIIISSNLERLLYHLSGDSAAVRLLMKDLGDKKKYQFDSKDKGFHGGYANELETVEAINQLYRQTGYVIDTHTAVAYACAQKYRDKGNRGRPMLVVSTASPYKFTADVMGAIDSKYSGFDSFALIKELNQVSGVAVPEQIAGIDAKPVLHQDVVDKNSIKDYIREKLA